MSERRANRKALTLVTRRRLVAVLASLTAIAALVVMLFPLYAVIVASFETNSQLFGASHYSFFPSTWTLSNYRTVLSQQGSHVISSLIIALGTAVLTLAIAIPAAHALARYRFRVTGLLVGSLLVAQILPSIVIANSLFLVYHRLHLLNSYPGLIVADASYAVPFGILVLRAFMLALPRDVIAAARVDGASEWQTFTRVVLPMSRSAIITVALFGFLNGWGDFIFALTLLNGNTFEPVTLSIYTYVGEFAQNWGEAMALSVFALLPAAMLLIAAQRYIAAGLTVGSVKGLPIVLGDSHADRKTDKKTTHACPRCHQRMPARDTRRRLLIELAQLNRRQGQHQHRQGYDHRVRLLHDERQQHRVELVRRSVREGTPERHRQAHLGSVCRSDHQDPAGCQCRGHAEPAGDRQPGCARGGRHRPACPVQQLARLHHQRLHLRRDQRVHLPGQTVLLPDRHQHGRHLLQQGHARRRPPVAADHLGTTSGRRQGSHHTRALRDRVRRDQ
jgi:multiple sugar transport system permease protein